MSHHAAQDRSASSSRVRAARGGIFALLLITLMLALSFKEAPSLAQDAPNPIDEPAKPRPDEAEARKAERVVKRLKDDEAARINAMRFLARKEEDEILLPSWRVAQGLPPLGTTTREEEQAFTPAESLRLAALLRSGYPVDDTIKRELADFFEVDPSYPDEQELFLQLLVCDALAARPEDGGLAKEREQGLGRAQRMAEDFPWTDREPKDSTLSLATMRDLYFEAMARTIVNEHDWFELPAGWSDALSTMWEKLGDDGEPWATFGAVSEQTYGFYINLYTRARSLIFISLVDSLARREGDLEIDGEDYADAYSKKRAALANAMANLGGKGFAESYKAKLKEGQTTVNIIGGEEITGYLITSASTAFSAMLANEYLPVDAQPKDKKLYPTALMLPEKRYSLPAGWDLDLAQVLGWTNLVIHSPVAAQMGGTATPRPDPVRAALSLLGENGGIVSTMEAREVIVESDWIEITEALTTLERAEIPRTLEERIDFAIDSSATWLMANMEKDGSFPGRYRTELGGHALALLAILDAGVDPDRKEVQIALKHMRKMTSGHPKMYAYGITLMCLQKYYEAAQEKAGMLKASDKDSWEKAAKKLKREFERGDEAWIDEMTDFLVKDFGGQGWGYANSDPATHRDNSNSQYAVLGLKAASLLGADFDRDVLKQEATRWLAEFVEDKTMDEIEVYDEPAEVEGDKEREKPQSRASFGKTRPGGWAYICKPDQTVSTQSMTAAGISSLAICRDELQLFGLLDAKMEREIAMRLAGSLHWTGKKWNYRSTGSLNASPPRNDGFGTLYNMYAIERACVLTEQVEIAGIDWYAEGAFFLLDAMTDGGQFPVLVDKDSPDVVDLCFLILFLKRAAIHIHRPKPAGPITGDGKKD